MELSLPLDSPLHEVLELWDEQLSVQYTELLLGDLDDSDAEHCGELQLLDSQTVLVLQDELLLDDDKLDALELDRATVLLDDAELSEQLDALLPELLECWLVVELVLWLLQDCVLYDCSDGLLPDREQDELDELELPLEDDSELLLLPTVLLLEQLAVDRVLHEL